ncbi:class I SAM-dependent methyltransferase [Gryllotalpicola reticulitermitis]|uniref:Class I SAM-dependent methyltransferase n=1 Tax=Gryllotalpicola reticulitermitis TaxID=1184153 RepID=A0ABV8Q261_9MICO
MAVRGRPAGSYGIDAAWVPWMWVGYTILYGLLALGSFAWWDNPWWLGVLFVLIAATCAAGAALYWYVTLRGKFLAWATLLDDVALGDGELALDLGCGHGAVAIEVARRNPGTVVNGIDLWRSIDQSGNSPEAFLRNADLNGVRDRITVATGDMTRLPYGEDVFALVTASLAIHNIPTAAGRREAVAEAWRVLRPGGTLLVTDIRRTAEYASVLRDAGADVASPVSLGWRMWWSGPWMKTRRLTAVKPHPTTVR